MSFCTRRRFASESAKHELYVCIHESSSQSLVEMAFALGFGTWPHLTWPVELLLCVKECSLNKDWEAGMHEGVHAALMGRSITVVFILVQYNEERSMMKNAFCVRRGTLSVHLHFEAVTWSLCFLGDLLKRNVEIGAVVWGEMLMM